MSNINKVIISGRLTRDPELRATTGGTAVLGLGMAVNDRRKNQQTGQWEDQTNFIDCTLFGSRAEALARVLSKGMLVCVEGHLRWSQWDTKDGQKRSKIEVIVDEIEIPSRPQGDGGQTYASQAQQADGSMAYAPQMQQGGFVPASQGFMPQPAMPQPTGYVPAPPYEQAYGAQPQPDRGVSQAPSYGTPTAQMPVEQVYDDEIPF